MSTSSPKQFAWPARILHWLMAVLLLAMLFIGAIMVTSLAQYRWLVALHRPLGIAILVLAVVRFVVRQRNPPPEFLATMSPRERFVATWSERLLYLLMITLPLVGWAMLSAADYPIVLVGSAHLPPILPASPHLFAVLRTAHSVLAYVLFSTFLAHLGGVLMHAIVLRDGILRRMVPWRPRG